MAHRPPRPHIPHTVPYLLFRHFGTLHFHAFLPPPSHVIRWAQLRTAMVPFPTLLEPITECLLLGFLAGLCAQYVIGIPFIIFYAAHICVWMMFDFFLLRNLQVSCLCVLEGGGRGEVIEMAENLSSVTCVLKSTCILTGVGHMFNRC